MTRRLRSWLPVWFAASGLGLGLGPRVAPAKGWPAKVPTADERGRELYQRHCQACHGERAAGDGAAAASLVVPVPDLSSGLGGRDREQLVQIVMRGKGVMPGFDQSFRDLEPHDANHAVYARNVLDYMDKLARGLLDPGPAPGDEDEDENEDDVGDAP